MRSVVAVVLLMGVMFVAGARAQEQALDDAWWTGPMLAPSASTLPRGHFLIEPYLYDVKADGTNGFGNLTYMLYGVADKFTVGMIPTAGLNVVSKGASSSGVGVGDLTVQGQYRLRKYRQGSWLPTMSVAVLESLPTGKFDRLGSRPSDGMGSGAYTTTLALYTQTYFWMPNGRILRTRFNVTQSFSRSADVRDVSVYGTENGFRGKAQPGPASYVNAAWEYSVTRRWVLALDGTYRHAASTSVRGFTGMAATRLDSGSSETFALAPAVEYNWGPNIGVLVGVRVMGFGHNTSISVTPAVALNFVH